MRRGRLGLLLAGVGATAAMLVPSPPALAQGRGEGATFEEFVCYPSTGENIRIGRGKVITTPSGEVRVICTGRPLPDPS